MLVCQIALVSEAQGISLADLTPVSAALQKQATRDLGPIWGVQATVDCFAGRGNVPPGYWTMSITDSLKASQGDGIHEDGNGQPFALVRARPGWSLSASHEAMEMLVDPSGRRTVSGQSPMPGQGRVDFLVEVCDPCQAPSFGYGVNGIGVSDFITPNYFDPIASSSVRYSFTGAIKMPREVLKAGYLGWHEPITNHLFRESFFGDQPDFVDLGERDPDSGQNLRSMIYSKTPDAFAARVPSDELLSEESACLAKINGAAQAKAAELRKQISALLGK